MIQFHSRLAVVLLASLAAAQLESDCPANWFDAADLGCYKFLPAVVNLSWVAAQEECEKEGGFLAEPATAE